MKLMNFAIRDKNHERDQVFEDWFQVKLHSLPPDLKNKRILNLKLMEFPGKDTSEM